jgi:hypothetical protein
VRRDGITTHVERDVKVGIAYGYRLYDVATLSFVEVVQDIEERRRGGTVDVEVPLRTGTTENPPGDRHFWPG